MHDLSWTYAIIHLHRNRSFPFLNARKRLFCVYHTMAIQHTILVTAASGNIGSRLVPQLLKDQVKLVLPTSNASRLGSQLSSQSTEGKIAIEEGSIKDPIWMEEILKTHHVDTVFLCFSGHDEIIITLNLLDVLRKVGTVKHLVFVSACGDFVSPKGFQEALATQTAAHVIAKPIIERKLIETGYPFTTTVLGPTLFFDNDLRSKGHILREGLLDEPLGEQGVSRVSPVDIAAVARNALIDQQKWAGKKINIGSKHRFTGTEVAKLWSEALGRPIRMCPSDEEGFNHSEALMNQKVKGLGEIGKAWARDLRHMYEGFAVRSFGLSDEEYDVLVDCLGREPLSYPEFVADTVKAWKTKA